MQHALDSLKALVRERYPEATFEVVASPDDPESVDLITTVDLEDPDEVVDLVIDQVLHFQLEECLPVHVIPVRPLARVLEEMRPAERRKGARIGA